MTDEMAKLIIFNDEIYGFIDDKIQESCSFSGMVSVNKSLELLDNFCDSDCLVSFDTIFDL